MEKEELINYFHSVNEKYFTIEVEDYKIFFPDYTALKKILSFIIAIVASIAFFYIAKYNLINNSINRYGRFIFTINDAYIITAIVFIGSFFCSLISIKKYIVIDLNNNCFFTEYRFFSIKIKTKTINKNDILQIGNNIFNYKSRFKIKGNLSYKKIEPDPETNLFFDYSISFLLNNGKTQNIFIGTNIEDYETSVTISKNFSEYFNIPLITCNKGNELSTREYFNSYKFEEIPSNYTKQISKS